MDFRRKISADTREADFQARARKARKSARLITVLLAGTCLTGVWQEKALQPWLHVKMHDVGDRVVVALEESDGARSFIASAFASSGGAAQKGEFDAITNKLLELRN